MQKINYSNEIFCFDIETTSINGVVSHYLSNFSSVYFFAFNLSAEQILERISKPHFCRTEKDINNFLEHLSKKAELKNEYTLIFVHNLAYEFDFLIKNIPFVYNNFKNENTLFLKTRIPVFFRVGNIEFRCSYKLLNKSLKTLGEQLGFPKLEIEYKKQYFSFSELPDSEYKYNARDTKLTLLAILSECKNWKFINSVKDIPLTATGLTRKNNKFISTTKELKKWSRWCNYQFSLSKEDIDFLENVYTGAYTHANPKFALHPICEKCCSIDIISSYPDSMLHRKYPHFFHVSKSKHNTAYLKKLFSENLSADLINNFQHPFKNAFLCTVTLKNVHVKHLRNGNLILPISFNKCIEVGKIRVDNGRIMDADFLTISCNEVDLYIFKMFYDFEISDCQKLWFTRYYSELPKFIIKSVKTYLHEKSTLKYINKKIEKNEMVNFDDFSHNNENFQIFDDEQIKSLLGLPNGEIEKTISTLYLTSKNKINAQYGINVQKLIANDIYYNLDEDEFSQERQNHIETKVLYRDFIVGIYITSYSRLNLFTFGKMLVEKTDAVLIYSDTDSWKCCGDLEKVSCETQKYNKTISTINHNENDYNVGCFDYESEFDYFCTLGCKKYIYSDGKKIFSTIAGVSKSRVSEAYSEFFKKLDFDFQTFCEIAFSPCTVLSYSITGKLLTKYQNDDFKMNVIDENGNGGEIHGKNMVDLIESDFLLMDITKPNISAYIENCARLQNRTFEFLPVILYKNNTGVHYKMVDDWAKMVKMYHSKNLNMENQLESLEV